jgi:hypothetical protein
VVQGCLAQWRSILVSGQVKDEVQRHWLAYVIAGSLAVLIAAAAVLDIFYYEQLLRGAVEGLLEFERQHPEIQLSTTIDKVVGRGKHTAKLSYSLVLLALAGFMWHSYRRYSAAAEARQAAKPLKRKGRKAAAGGATDGR